MASKGTVWLVSQYEPAPGDTWRPMRSAYVARSLIKRGYAVVQWSATFNHQARSVCAHAWEEREVEPGWTVRFVPNSAYKANVSRKRMASEASFARNFRNRAKTEPKPTCIVVREPPAVLGQAAVKLGREYGIAIVSDVIDLWPEFFHRVLPKSARKLGKGLFGPLYARRRRMWSSIDAVCAVSETYVEHARSAAPHLRTVPSACVYTSIELAFVQQRMKVRSEIVERAVGKKPEGELWIGYAGSLGTGYDIPVFLRAAEILRARHAHVRFIMAGVGPFVAQIKEAAALSGANITFLGQLSPDDLYPMLGKCDIGLLSYSGDTTVAIPDKFYDYVAVGLPIVNSLQGEVRQTIESQNLGLTYTPGDADAMVAAIDELAKNPALREAMKVNAGKAALSWDAPMHFEKFTDLIEEAIALKSNKRT